MLSYNDLLVDVNRLFPYDKPNPQQIKIIQAILSTPTPGALFIQSSTGSGKTIAALTSMLARRQEGQKILVFVRTVSQMEPILREFGRIYKYGSLKNASTPRILPILGKARVCKMLPHIPDYNAQAVSSLCKSVPCKLHPDVGESNKYKSSKYYLDKVNRSIQGSSKNKTPDINKIRIYFRDMLPTCGYYTMRDMLKSTDIVVLTYPYLQPLMMKMVLNSMKVKIGDTLILVDEAHNLAQARITEISVEDIEMVEKLFGKRSLFLNLKKVLKQRRRINPSEIATEEEWMDLEKILRSADHKIRTAHNINLIDLSRMEVVRVANFISARHNGIIYTRKNGLSILQANPRLDSLDGAALQIYQSGTLQPMDQYKKLFGKKYARTLVTEPETDENKFRAYLTWKGVTSKYRRRGKKMYDTMAHIILEIYKKSPRHVLVVNVSYEMKDALIPFVHKEMDKHGIDREYLVNETPKLNALRLSYKIKKSMIDRPLILMGVSSGKITEGVEFTRDGMSMLSTVIFTGIPFRPPSNDDIFLRKMISSITSDQNAGYEFMRKIPVIRAIKQAYGRTIRTTQDRGALVILDFRAKQLHKDLDLRLYPVLPNLLNHLEEFYEGYPSLDQV